MENMKEIKIKKKSSKKICRQDYFIKDPINPELKAKVGKLNMENHNTKKLKSKL